MEEFVKSNLFIQWPLKIIDLPYEMQQDLK